MIHEEWPDAGYFRTPGEPSSPKFHFFTQKLHILPMALQQTSLIGVRGNQKLMLFVGPEGFFQAGDIMKTLVFSFQDFLPPERRVAASRNQAADSMVRQY